MSNDYNSYKKVNIFPLSTWEAATTALNSNRKTWLCKVGRRYSPPSKSSRLFPPSPMRLCRSSSLSTRRRLNSLSCLKSPSSSCLFDHLHRRPCSRWQGSVLKVDPSRSPLWLWILRMSQFAKFWGEAIRSCFYHFFVTHTVSVWTLPHSHCRAQPPPNWRYYLPPSPAAADRDSEQLPASASQESWPRTLTGVLAWDSSSLGTSLSIPPDMWGSQSTFVLEQ